MKKFTFKRQLLFVMLMLLGCLSIQAADDGLITNQVVINLDEPGTLPQKISASDKYLITNLKVKGDINGTDLGFLREMAGQSINGIDETNGKLSTLDLSDTKIVGGGEPYFNYGGYETYFTEYNKIGKYAFCSCNNLKRLTLPKDITSIEQSAFFGCSGLTSITIPSSVTAIGKWSFYGCISLTSLDLPSSLTTVGELALAGCSQLTSLTLHSNLTEVKSNYLFGGNSNYNNLKDVRYIIDSDLETYLQSNHPIFYQINCGIKYYLNDQEITTLEIPSGITSIGDGVFFNSNGLTNLTLSSRVTSIGESAFNNCSNLQDVRYYIYDDLATYIQKGHPAFYINCGIKYYWNNQEITTLEIPTSVTSIGNHAFYGGNGLTSVEFPSNLSSIGDWAFKGCSGLTSVDLPSSITKMGECVFVGCQGLTKVNLPSGITAISKCAFGWCISLKNLELPAGITSIGDDAFIYCSSLQNINLPSGITSIGDYAFENCSSLRNINLPSKISSIGDAAFIRCSNMTSLSISSNITSIGRSAFSDCKSLKNLTISKDVTSIKDILFNFSLDDLELKSVYVAWQNPIEAGSFFNYIKISNCTLYVPQGTKEAYANADVWKDFGNIIEYDATGIDKVTNRSDVKEISRYSLNGQRVTSPTKGVNIVVYSDGSIKKVVVQ